MTQKKSYVEFFEIRIRIFLTSMQMNVLIYISSLVFLCTRAPPFALNSCPQASCYTLTWERQKTVAAQCTYRIVWSFAFTPLGLARADSCAPDNGPLACCNTLIHVSVPVRCTYKTTGFTPAVTLLTRAISSAFRFDPLAGCCALVQVRLPINSTYRTE